MKNKLLGSYQNGNYTVAIFSDGTKIRQTKYDDFVPSFSENCDVHISDKCNKGCKFCYANCTPKGEFGNLLNQKFLDGLHPYTEMALNLNFPAHPDLEEFLAILKNKKVIANLTVNQDHFIQHQDYIQNLKDKELFTALGVSLTEANDTLVELLNKYDNSVLHVINGLISESDLTFLSDKGVRMLILGYKDLGRGVEHLKDNDNEITTNQKYLYDNIKDLVPKFKVVSFDNLSLKQLEAERLMSKEEWEEFYMGDDGTVTFFINLVDNTFSKNSLCETKFPILDNIDDMFKHIVEQG